MNILRVCVDNNIVFCGPANSFECMGSFLWIYADAGNKGVHRGNGHLTVEWLSAPFIFPEARTAVRDLIRTATIVPLDMYYADDAAVFQSLLPALADTVSDDTIDQVILDVLCAYRRS